MTYNEWRDELKSNLLCVPESERRRVLDYYAEAYADRREAGFSEREIIEEFGAPYDAAQRILTDNKNNGYYEDVNTVQNRQRQRDDRARRSEPVYPPPPPPQAPAPQATPAPAPASNPPAASTRTDNTWIFVLLCIIFAVPIFGVVLAMVIITVSFCVAPVAIVGSGIASLIAAIGSMISGSVAYGFIMLGASFIIIGLGIILCPLFFKLVGLMWKLFNKFFSWLKSLFSGKERA